MPCSEPVAGCHAECRLDCHSTRGTQTQQRRRAPPTRGGVNKSAGFILLSCVALLLLCGCCFSSALDANSGNEQSTKAWTPPTGDGERDDQGGTEESESELEQAARESYEKGSGEDWWGDDRTPGTSVEKLHVLLDILAPVSATPPLEPLRPRSAWFHQIATLSERCFVTTRSTTRSS